MWAQRRRRRLEPSAWGRLPGGYRLLAVAAGVGLAAGAGAIGFRELIAGFTRLFTGHSDYSALGHVANPHLPGLGIWFVVLAPVVGGLLYGPIVARFAPEARGHGVPEVMLAVAEHGGRIRPQVPVVKALASALCIGSGGSVGREGPIVQIGSAVGSVLGQLARVPPQQLRLLVACGAAGGISATFNAPIAGVFFALEVILRDFATESFGAVVLSSVIAAALARAAFGDTSFLHLAPFALASPLELVFYAGLGVLAGGTGVLFIRTLYGAEDLADRVWGRRPQWARPVAGGVLLGLLLLVLPQMYGVGYPVLGNAVAGHYALLFLFALMAGKILASSLTIAIGGSGGVFAPSLFIGAMLGSVYGRGAHALLPHLTAPAGAYGLVGMGAVFAGAARAPITAVIIVFELTNDYTIILPLMFAIVVAAAVSGVLSRDTIYTLKLRRRGIRIDRPRVVSVMQTVTVGAAMTDPPVPLPADAPLGEVIRRLTEGRIDTLPVIADDDSIIGVVGPRDIERVRMQDDEAQITAGVLARPAPSVRVSDSLEDAAHALGDVDAAGVPVLAEGNGHVVGWLTHRDLLLAYRRERQRLSPKADPDTAGRSSPSLS